MRDIEVVQEWKGRDGNDWREIRVPTGGRFTYIIQRRIVGGIWI